jgi:tyrosyl-tRNA synthetase
MMIKPVRKVTSGVFLKRGFGGDVESHKLIDNLKSELLTTLRNRGFLYQCTDYEELDRLADESPIHAYLGFDATAPSLHVGSLIQIMMLRHLQQSGHKPIILIGGGTTKIGDPSGKDQSRQLISDEAIEKNILGISGVFNRFLKFGNGPSDAIIVNNSNWLGKLQYVNFLQEYGRHITLNRMLSFESVKSRLAREEPLTLLEFNYMLLQAYDFLHLHETMGVSLQLGGSDQWGNIICGVELGRKMKKVFKYLSPFSSLTISIPYVHVCVYVCIFCVPYRHRSMVLQLPSSQLQTGERWVKVLLELFGWIGWYSQLCVCSEGSLFTL